MTRDYLMNPAVWNNCLFLNDEKANKHFLMNMKRSLG